MLIGSHIAISPLFTFPPYIWRDDATRWFLGRHIHAPARLSITKFRPSMAAIES